MFLAHLITSPRLLVYSERHLSVALTLSIALSVDELSVSTVIHPRAFTLRI